MAISTQQGLGSIQLCIDTGLNNCATLAVDADVCKGVPTGFDNDISSVGLSQGIICTLFEYVDSPAATERRII